MKMSFKAMSEDKRFLTTSEGNKKLKPSKDLKYLIWNIPAIITCPGATEHCKYFCYAIKAEKQYPDCKESRKRHFTESQGTDFVERMIYTIESHLSRPSYETAKKVVIRIHESGDFYSQEYTNKWLAIAEHFKGNKKVVFMAYTKSVWFFIGKEIPENMTVRFSLWDDTKEEDKAIAESLGLPVYTAVKKFTNESKKEKCLCENCTTCQKCWSALAMLKCEIH